MEDNNTKPQTSAPTQIPQSQVENHEDASRRPGTGPPPLAGVGLKIERDVGGRGFRIAGVASNGPGECLMGRTRGVSLLALTLMRPCSCEYGRQGE